MSVYVDELRNTPKAFLNYPVSGWLYDRACHMMADSDAELEAMAKQLRLPKYWKHGDHYNLTDIKRWQAVAAGAVEVTVRKTIELRRRSRSVLDEAAETKGGE